MSWSYQWSPMSRVSMELLLRLLLLQLESIGPPKKEYFCKIKFQQLAFKKFWVQNQKLSQKLSSFEIQISVSKSSLAGVPRHSLVPGYKYLSWRTFWVVQLPQLLLRISIYLWVLVVQSENQNLKSSLNRRNPSVQLCRVYRKPKIRSPPGWIPIKSPNYHSPNACCYMFNFKPGIRVVSI